MRMVIWLLFLVFPIVASAQSSGRFLEKVRLPEGQTVLVAEGELEARSIGSFSVRVYEAASPEDDTTFFVDGLIHSRDGALEKVVLANVDSTSVAPEIVVVVRSVGTGSALRSHEIVRRSGGPGSPPTTATRSRSLPTPQSPRA